jgi:hydroxypyruvate isomerase
MQQLLYETIVSVHRDQPITTAADRLYKLNYPAIMRALLKTGYNGYVGQEFVPLQKDKLESLRKCIRICDV